MATPANLAQLRRRRSRRSTRRPRRRICWSSCAATPPPATRPSRPPMRCCNRQAPPATAAAAAFSLPLTSLALGVERAPDADLALISVPGDYAAAEAMKALSLGLHVMLFSDNVPVADERAIKTYAREHDLLVMGPDCGTAIVNGVPLGFANVVRRGDIGLVAASGTGLQEVTCRIHNLGGGVSQALGTGGRDLKEEIGGITMLQGLARARRRPATRVIVLISKPPSPAIARQIERCRRRGRQAGRRAFPRRDAATPAAPASSRPRRCAHAADVAVALARGEAPPRGHRRRRPAAAIAAVDERVAEMAPAQTCGARALHRRHVLLRGAARVPRARPALPLQRAGRGRAAVRRTLRRPRVPRPRRRRLHARPPASDDRPVAARRARCARRAPTRRPRRSCSTSCSASARTTNPAGRPRAGAGRRAARGARARPRARVDRPCLRHRRRPAGQGGADAAAARPSARSSPAAMSRRRCWRRIWPQRPRALGSQRCPRRRCSRNR